MRKKLIAGNWKSNGSLELNKALLEGIVGAKALGSVDVVVCPPFPYLQSVGNVISGSMVELGAQNCSATEEGAYTGEVSARMCADIKCSWVIVGHSERRALYAENDEIIARKVKRVVDSGLTPILCVGETLEERESGQAEEVTLKQLDAVFLSVQPHESWVVAYEPVWAIGTGKTASPDDAQSMHKALRNNIRKHFPQIADKIRILYGGSVKSSNAKELFSMPDVDGALVGGASLVSEEFVSIIEAAVE
ncbi:triose-phosphate isomerase [Hahella aquimaris]|uniref:triose-phosphate isomerase n=1 Tax=Hahella sp. HNIBRBA332 TaxID=3015983 RepID=UPI00273CB620|nr:triose-phosphate isomerase [Hahella sp. HNIBRBA332]WLQ12057.1 triose-phosphate isomerase [Hahella sp. HNIBRBA332]